MKLFSKLSLVFVLAAFLFMPNANFAKAQVSDEVSASDLQEAIAQLTAELNALQASGGQSMSYSKTKLGKPSLKIIYPNGGETFVQGGSYEASPITWESNNVASVYLKLKDVKGDVSTLASRMDNKGKYSWTVPADLPNGKYKIGVISTKIDAVDYSDDFFVIGTPTSPDMNNDGKIDGADIGLMLSAWGACTATPCPGDINGDGTVGIEDANLLLAKWGPLP